MSNTKISFSPLDLKGRPLKISVISPTFNHSQYIRQNLDSLLSQNYPHFEVIVVNDASTDNTHDILTEYAQKDSRLKYLKLEKNRGVMGAFNEGYKLVTGDMIYGSASDDYVSTPTFFEKVVISMEQKPEAAGVFGQAEMVSAETGAVQGLLGGVVGYHGYVPPEVCLLSLLSHRALIPGVSCMWRKDLVDKIGGYPEELGPQSDYFVNHALASMAGVVFLPKKVAVHRMSTKSYNANVTFQDRIHNYALVEKHFRRLNLHMGVNQKVFDEWRLRQIESFLTSDAQRKLFELFKKIVGSLNTDFWSYVPEEAKKFFSSIPTECDRLEGEIDRLRSWALDEFKRETGC